jgi:hypothetical protein
MQIHHSSHHNCLLLLLFANWRIWGGLRESCDGTLCFCTLFSHSFSSIYIYVCILVAFCFVWFCYVWVLKNYYMPLRVLGFPLSGKESLKNGLLKILNSGQWCRVFRSWTKSSWSLVSCISSNGYVALVFDLKKVVYLLTHC